MDWSGSLGLGPFCAAPLIPRLMAQRRPRWRRNRLHIALWARRPLRRAQLSEQRDRLAKVIERMGSLSHDGEIPHASRNDRPAMGGHTALVAKIIDRFGRMLYPKLGGEPLRFGRTPGFTMNFPW